MISLPTKWRCCCCLALLVFSLKAYTQINITGRVVDGNDDSPLPGASVYFNKTTIGTYTNEQGNFYFEAVRLLNTELVISCAGYEILVLDKPTAEQLEGKRFIFKLKLKEQTKTCNCNPSAANRKRMLQMFYRNFLGVSKEAEKCTVLNEPVIYFVSDTGNATFKVYADAPLMIINNLLGYKLSINLIEFGFEKGKQHYVKAYTRYDEIPGDKVTIINRQKSYYGSTLHFYRSLITHQLYQQGFNTFIIKPPEDSMSARLHNSGQISDAVEMNELPITAQQILYIDSTNNFSINITGWLLVQYDKEPALKKKLKQNIYMQGYLPKGVESYISFKYSPIGINKYGVLSDYENVSYTGYWMYEKAANLLPCNYQPE